MCGAANAFKLSSGVLWQLGRGGCPTEQNACAGVQPNEFANEQLGFRNMDTRHFKEPNGMSEPRTVDCGNGIVKQRLTLLCLCSL